MKKVLTIGGATQDIFIQHQELGYINISTTDINVKYFLLQAGAKIEVKNILSFTGGGGTNSAVSFIKQGFKVSCFVQTGKDEEGKQIINELKRARINTDYLVTTNQYSTGKSYILNSSKGEKTIFAYRGANGHLHKNKLPIQGIEKHDFIYITSLSNESAQLLPLIVEKAKVKKVKVAINPGISQLTQGTLTLKKCLKYIDIFILNATEAKLFMMALISKDKSYKKLLKSNITKTLANQHKKNEPYLLNEPMLEGKEYFSMTKFFKEIIKMGPKIVVITNDENGVYVAANKKIIFHPSLKIKVVDTVGAGDAFGSAFVGFLMQNESIEKALIAGIINSASVIKKISAKAGLLSQAQINREIQKIGTKEIQRFPL